LIDGEIFTSRNVAARVSRDSRPSSNILQSIYIRCPAAPGTHLTLFAEELVFTRQRNTNFMSSENCNVASLQ
jgi:hypothetical protein